ncbi:MAG: hypothetical protein R3F56_23435 [Planctomycetota bacterium]
MRGSIWVSVFAGVVCSVAGLATGYSVGHRGADASLPASPGGHAEPPELSPLALDNLGVTFASAERRDLTVTAAIAAIVDDAPDTVQPLVAPIGGRVLEVVVPTGAVVRAGAPVLRLLRDALPRPTLTLTGPLLSPASESLHDAVHSLRQAFAEVDIVAQELQRIEPFTEPGGDGDLPVLPRQRAIDLRQQLARARAAYAHRVAELDKHGLSDEQIDAVAGGAALPAFDEAMWRQALLHNGLWTGAAQTVHEALPPGVRSTPWVIATIGELAANGLLPAELAVWLRQQPEAGAHFLAIGALLQQGETLAAVRRLYELGAFAPEVALAAPEHPAPDWDVHEVRVRPGVEVAAGDIVAILRDPRHLQLRVTPLGSEAGILAHAVADGLDCVAEPLVPDTGPSLEGVRVSRLDSEAGETVALARVANAPLVRAADGPAGVRSWQLRVGLRYLLRVPQRRLTSVFVLPVAALAQDGSRELVFIRGDHGIEPIEVRLLHRDDRLVAVDVPADSELQPGVEVVQSGAFALSLALQDEGGADHHHH